MTNGPITELVMAVLGPDLSDAFLGAWICIFLAFFIPAWARRVRPAQVVASSGGSACDAGAADTADAASSRVSAKRSLDADLDEEIDALMDAAKLRYYGSLAEVRAERQGFWPDCHGNIDKDGKYVADENRWMRKCAAHKKL
eukprot:TRINITY_DN54009_c0_g1_i1.p1 TRINITY_DN54009_c0_g1~~TRINITY_DN54009_c0_g1_i1.p1  ORF type:complete len:142 (+),score=35.00 TRINITY_DN54009_c0_g1_i1:128-553(+)